MIISWVIMTCCFLHVEKHMPVLSSLTTQYQSWHCAVTVSQADCLCHRLCGTLWALAWWWIVVTWQLGGRWKGRTSGIGACACGDSLKCICRCIHACVITAWLQIQCHLVVCIHSFGFPCWQNVTYYLAEVISLTQWPGPGVNHGLCHVWNPASLSNTIWSD